MKINIDNYELYFLRYIEGRLSEEERKEVETFLIQHPDLKEIMDMYDPSFTLVKDEELVFDDKDSLMRPTKSSFVMPLWVRYASVAAVALFVVSVGLVWMQRQQPTQNIVLADNAIDIDIIEEKYVPMISDSTIDSEKLYFLGAIILKEESDLQDKFMVVDGAENAQIGRCNRVECCSDNISITPGKPSKAGGEAASAALRRAISDLKSGSIDALVTAPIDKEMIQSEEFNFTGHTEFLAKELDGTPLMIMTSELMRVGLATIHIPVSEVADHLSKELIVERINQINASMREDFGVVRPKVAVLALNPHAGDGGLLGKEENEVIKPAIVDCFERDILAFGPFAADGFFASGQFKNYDAILAMYHDQGLAPFKTLTPDGVNFTASLSAVRTSPDHGVAYDIAGKGIADEQSMRNALYDAIDIVRRRRAWAEWNANPLEHFEREKGRDVSIKDLPEQEHHD